MNKDPTAEIEGDLKILKAFSREPDRHSLHGQNVRSGPLNRLFPNYLWPLFQSESWCSSFHMKISFHSHANEN